MEFVNPATGGPAMPTMGAYIQLLAKGFSGHPYRSTDGTVYSVIEGSGRAVIGGEAFEFTARDTFVVPSWQSCALSASEETVLFSYSDRPVQRALGLWREEQLQ
jgi:gentisate 1,2-dioxygenase